MNEPQKTPESLPTLMPQEQDAPRKAWDTPTFERIALVEATASSGPNFRFDSVSGYS